MTGKTRIPCTARALKEIFFGKGGRQLLTDLKANMKWKVADKASIRQTGSVFYRESGLGVMCPPQLLFPCAVGD